MRLKNKKLNMKKIGLTIFFSFIYTIGMQLFLAPAGLIATGVAGIAQMLDMYVPVNISYSIFYLGLNIPGFYLGFKKIGYQFTMYSVISVMTVTLGAYILPSPSLTQAFTSDIIINCVFGGIIMGYGIGGLLKIGASSGGTDFFGVILYDKYGFDFSKVNMVINVSIIIVATVLGTVEIGLYTVLSFYVRNLTINQIFTSNKKMTVWIIGRDLTRVSTYINQKLGHGTTIINGEGGYTLSEKQIIMTILTQYEYAVLRENIHYICDDAFINVTECYEVEGNFKRKRKA